MSVGDRRCYKFAYSAFLCLCLSLLLAVAGCGGTASAGSGGSTKVLTAIAATPGTASLAVGASQQFTATATYNDGSTADVTASATWTDANAKVAAITASGMATAVAAGSTTVTAAMGALSGSATLTVAAGPKTLTSIAVSPATATIAVGATQQFAATASYSDGTTADVTATAAWTSSTTTVATITSTGLATAAASGSTTMTATVSGISGAAAVTVPVPAPGKTLTSIAVTPATPSIAAGATQQFTATATYSDSTQAVVTSTVTWTSATPAIATMNTSGLAKALAPGSTVITASLNSISGAATLTVTPAVVSIAVTPNPAATSAGATQQFTAVATYSDNTTKDVTATANWKSAKTTIATINATTGLATGVAAGSTTVTASLSGISGSATLNVTGVTITPSPATFAVGATQQFTATQNNADGTTTDITATANWASANTAVVTVAAGGLATGVAAGSTSITASLNGLSGKVTVTVTLAGSTGVSIPTWHVDNSRSGLNPNETSLTPANVAPATFGKLFSYLVDGYAYAEPLLISNLAINGGTHNVLYVATEHDSVYALDADNYGTGTPLWKTSLLQSGETPLTGGTVTPFQGVTSTPVIDHTTNTIYVVSAQKTGGNASYRLNALDITTGQPKHTAVTINATVPGTNSTAVNGNVSLPGGCVQRAALLLANGNVYIGFGSCHSGWLLSYNAQSLAQNGVFNVSPNIDGEGTYGGAGGVWMGSGGPIADSSGNIYVSTGNGPYDTTQGSYSDSILKFSPTLQLLDHFTPQDFDYMNCEDSDLAAGGLLMIPGTGQIVGGGKMGKLYLVNTANLGGEQANDAGAAYTLFVEIGLDSPYMSTPPCVDSRGSHSTMINSYEIFGTAAYFNGSIYLGVTPTSPTAQAAVRRIAYSSAGGGTLTAQDFTSPSIQQNTRGTTPFISANGNSDGILWMIDEGQPLGSSSPTSATLRAYDAGNLSNALYNSSQNAGDVPGYGIKFTSPIVANGKAYISTGHDPVTATNPQGEIDVYGLK